MKPDTHDVFLDSRTEIVNAVNEAFPGVFEEYGKKQAGGVLERMFGRFEEQQQSSSSSTNAPADVDSGVVPSLETGE